MCGPGFKDPNLHVTTICWPKNSNPRAVTEQKSEYTPLARKKFPPSNNNLDVC